MKVTYDKTAKTLTIVMPVSESVSKSGKSLVIASTGGNKASDAEYKGKKIVCGINCYIPKGE